VTSGHHYTLHFGYTNTVALPYIEVSLYNSFFACKCKPKESEISVKNCSGLPLINNIHSLTFSCTMLLTLLMWQQLLNIKNNRNCTWRQFQVEITVDLKLFLTVKHKTNTCHDQYVYIYHHKWRHLEFCNKNLLNYQAFQAYCHTLKHSVGEWGPWWWTHII
jgi:hypothetical protein